MGRAIRVTKIVERGTREGCKYEIDVSCSVIIAVSMHTVILREVEEEF